MQMKVDESCRTNTSIFLYNEKGKSAVLYAFYTLAASFFANVMAYC